MDHDSLNDGMVRIRPALSYQVLLGNLELPGGSDESNSTTWRSGISSLPPFISDLCVGSLACFRVGRIAAVSIDIGTDSCIVGFEGCYRDLGYTSATLIL
jgi:hypothetical protein